ncbi:hypothetical protein [Aeromicrobium sp. UC242_57]|uniref:hypothetical protein n=1 Tax=Aeromicrobium sp. UC242_57 TaxID=3374624 RepID=UPI003790CEDE
MVLAGCGVDDPPCATTVRSMLESGVALYIECTSTATWFVPILSADTGTVNVTGEATAVAVRGALLA